MSAALSDPIERMVAEALDRADIRYTHEYSGHQPPLDFHLTDLDVFIEVKQFHSDRIARQMSKAENVIAIQGRKAAETFCRLVAVQAELNRLRYALVETNEALRSTFQVADREGKDTNWVSFRQLVGTILARHHPVVRDARAVSRGGDANA